MAHNSREVFDIDEQALLNSIADDAYKRQQSAQSIQTIPADNILYSVNRMQKV
jgi:hypothetical protein